jgi:hypothetical protein
VKPRFSIRYKILSVVTALLVGAIAMYLALAMRIFKQDKSELVFDLNRSVVSTVSAEYRTLPNRVAGDFRTTLNYWHMGRIFDLTAPPHLNSDFVESNPTHRVFADTTPTDQKMYVHCLNRIRAVRPLPKYGTPAL